MGLDKVDQSRLALEDFSGTSLTIARELGDKTSLPELVEALGRIWEQRFGNRDLGFSQLQVEGEALKLIPQDLYPCPEGLETQIPLIPVAEISYSHIHHLDIGNSPFNIFFIGFEREPLGFFWWKKVGAAHEHSLQQLIMGQVAILSRWCSRFQKAQELLHRDDLTGLYNYRYLESCLNFEVKRVQRFQSNFSLLFIDLDRFKPVNDQYGHLAGSHVLKQVADVLRLELRDVDSIFRYGGDEFVVMLLEADGKQAYGVAERIREKIELTRFVVNENDTVSITASIGVACCPEHGQGEKELLRLADECMYKSKRTGKNKVVMLDRVSTTRPSQTELEKERR